MLANKTITTKTKPTVPDVITLVRKYYTIEGNGCGGSLHIVLDDGNVFDSDVQFCIDTAHERGDAVGVALGETLLQMSRTQRRKIHMLH